MDKQNQIIGNVAVFRDFTREAEVEYGIRPVELPRPASYHAVVIAVAHRQFRAMATEDFRRLCVDKGVIYDVKHLLAEGESDGRL